MIQNMIIATMFFLLSLLVVSCSTEQKALPAAPPSPEAGTSKGVTEEAWQKEWTSLLKAAQKEGSFILYCSANGRFQEYIGKAVKEKLGIQMDFFSMRGAAISTKLNAERRAGIYMADVYVGGSTTIATIMKPSGILDPLEPVIFLPEALDPKAWWGGGLRWLNKDRTNLALLSYVNRPVAINTTMINPGELSSFRDLLNPKFKGKIILDNPTRSGTGQKLISIVGEYIMGWDYIRELVKQELIILADYRQEVEWLAQGKASIVMGADVATVESFKEAGAPLMYISFKEGSYLTSGMGSLALINKAPHPNAAKAFVNWMLTREGQTVLSQAELLPSTRTDVINTALDPTIRLQPGVKYIESDTEEVMLRVDERSQMIKEIFTPVTK